MSPKAGDYARAQASGVRCVPLLVETFGGLSPPLVDALRAAAEWRKNKLTASEYDETTWSARTWMAFVTQRLSVASQLSMAQEAAEALGLSVAADGTRVRCEGLLGPRHADSSGWLGSLGAMNHSRARRAGSAGVGVPPGSGPGSGLQTIFLCILRGVRYFPPV